MKLQKYLWQYLIDNQEKVTDEEQSCPGCGSCRYYDFTYDSQLRGKLSWVKSLYSDVLNYEEGIEVVKSPKEKHYRNKMDYVATQGKIGMRRGGFANVFDVENSCIFDPDIGRDLKEFRKFKDYPDYDLFTHEGVIRYFVFRKHEYKGDIEHSLTVVLNEIPEKFSKDLIAFMKESFLWKKFDNIFLVQQPSLADLSYGKVVEVLKGGKLHQDLSVNGKTFSFVFGPQSFFQANTAMFEKVLEYMTLKIGDNTYSRIVDMYGGVGSIGIILSNHAHKLISVESNPENTEYFDENTKLNELDNSEIILSTVEDYITSVAFDSKDLLVIDPPRAGMMPKVVEKFVNLKILPKTIIYMSCNPATQVRDIKVLSQKYKIDSVRVFDMFPYTSHVESVTFLTKR